MNSLLISSDPVITSKSNINIKNLPKKLFPEAMGLLLEENHNDDIHSEGSEDISSSAEDSHNNNSKSYNSEDC